MRTALFSFFPSRVRRARPRVHVDRPAHQARPAHQVQAARTSFLAIVRGLEKSVHIVLGLLVAATAAGCWAGLYWRTESAPVMELSLVVTLLYTLLQLLDQKQAAALTCLGEDGSSSTRYSSP